MAIEGTFTEFNSAIYGTLGALLAGTVIQLANKILNRKKDQLDEHLLLRKELREELDAVKEEVHKLQVSLDEWKQKYYLQVEITNELKMEVQKLTDELTEYKSMSGNFPIIKPKNDD
jgi:hypothetical protein